MAVTSIARGPTSAVPSVHNVPTSQPTTAPHHTPCSPDALMGMLWWNRITEAERGRWLEAAGSFVPADAWATFKRTGGALP
jgi:hypothetical protein